VAGPLYIHLAHPINRENRVLGEKHLLALLEALGQLKTDCVGLISIKESITARKGNAEEKNEERVLQFKANSRYRFFGKQLSPTNKS